MYKHNQAPIKQTKKLPLPWTVGGATHEKNVVGTKACGANWTKIEALVLDKWKRIEYEE